MRTIVARLTMSTTGMVCSSFPPMNFHTSARLLALRHSDGAGRVGRLPCLAALPQGVVASDIMAVR